MQHRNAPAATAAPIASMRELATLVGRDVAQISRWTKRDDWTFARKAPWPRVQLPEILRWVAGTIDPRDRDPQPAAPAGPTPPASGAAPGAPIVATAAAVDDVAGLRRKKLTNECRKLLAHAETAETALAKERGRLIDAEQVEAEWAALGNLVRTAMENLAGQLVPLALNHGLPHQAAPEFGRQLEEAIAGVLRHLSRSANDDADPEPEEPAGGPAPLLPRPDAARAVDAVAVG